MPDFTAHVRNCRSCNAPIIWARTMTGRQMPVDAEPADGGNVHLSNIQGHIRAVVYTADTAARMLTPGQRTQLRMSHFATCPDAKGWRH